jgi:enoyl-CoA hydratase/carnithine racemase
VDAPEALGAKAVLELVAGGLEPDAVGPFAGRSCVVVHIDDAPELAEATGLLRGLPCVSVGIAPTVADRVPDLDVLLTTAPSPPSPWVAVADLAAGAIAVADAVNRSPMASIALAQLLRLGVAMSLADALVAESLTYGMLQSGPDFRHWLTGRAAPDAPAAEPDEAVLTERDGERLTITLNRPQVHNALNAAMRDAWIDALRVAVADESIELIELRGAGSTFCSGGDLREFGTTPDPVTGHLIRSTQGVGSWLARCAERTTAYVHGACVGAGCELAAFAGRVVAHPDTTFCVPEVAMGLIPGAGGTASLPRRIGRERTAWLALTGVPIDATTALHWGLVDATDPAASGDFGASPRAMRRGRRGPG